MGFSQFGAGEFAALLRDSGQGAVLIGLVWIVFRLVPRVPAAARCLVWWMLCLKMLVGLVLVIAPVKLAVLPTAPRLTIDAFRTATLPASRSGRSEEVGKESTAPSILALDSSRCGRRGESVNDWALLRTLWLTGIGVFLVLLAAQFVKAGRMLREASVAPPGRCWEIMTAAAKALKVVPRPPVFISLRAHSPLTAGLFKPVVLLPGKDAFSLSDNELLMVLAHETAHIRRRDLWLGLVPAAAQAVFFFHPLVWLAHREYLLAREEACDALALSETNLPADDYGRLLLRFGTTRGGASAAVAISGAQAAHTLRRRLAMLSAAPSMTIRQRWAWSAGLCAFGVLCLTPVALTERSVRSSQSAHLTPEIIASTGQLTTRRLTLRTVAPDVLKQTIEVADARLATSPNGVSSHVAQAPVEIRELPSGVVPLAPQAPLLPPTPPSPPAPPAPALASPDPVPAPRAAPAPRVHVVVPPIAPIHVHVAPIHIHVPDINVNIPDIKVDIPAMPGFTVDVSRAEGTELSDKDKREFFKQWKGPGLSDKDKQELFRQWNGTVPQSRQWAKSLQGLVRQESLDEAKRDREDIQRDRQEARQEAAQDRAESLAETKEAREEARQEAAEAKQEAQQEITEARQEAKQEAADGMDSAQEALSEAESELREELRDNSSGIARQALEQALKCVQKSRKTLPKQ